MSGLNVIAGGYASISTTAKSLTDFTWNSSSWATHRKKSVLHAYITVEDADIRYWDDGTSPTSSTGHLVGIGLGLDWTDKDRNYRNALDGLKIISVSGTAKVTITLMD